MNAVALLLVGWLLPAQPVTGQGSIKDTMVRLSVTLNTEPRGEISARLRGDDVLIEPMPELLKRTYGSAEVIDGKPWLSLRSLAPAVVFTLNEEDVTLAITVNDVTSLPETRIDARPRMPDGGMIRRTPSAFLNYDVEMQDFARGVTNLEGGATIGPGVLVANATAVAYKGFRPVRGLTSYTIDDRERMQRFSFGDTFVNGGVLGGANYFGGFVLARSFDLDPFFLYEPTAGFAGAASTPSTLDVYVGDVLIRREALPAGPFRLDGIPMMQGAGATRYVLRDAFGRETSVTTSQYGTRRLLAKGLTDYVASIGFARRGFGRESFDYEGKPTFLGRYRRGFTDTFTAETRLELAPWMASGGGAVAWRSPIGVFSGTTAASIDDGIADVAAQADWSYISRRWSLAFYGQYTGNRYANSSLSPTDDRATLEGTVQLAVPIGNRASLSATYGRSRMRDTGLRDNASAALSVSLTPSWLLLVTGSRVTPAEGAPISEMFATLRYVFGQGASAGAGAHVVKDQKLEAVVDAQKPTPVLGGLGYRVQGAFTDDGLRQGTAQGTYQSSFARFDLRADRLDGRMTTVAAVSGGLVYMSGADLYATRAVRQSYAVVRVPDRKNVRVLVDNREIGRTDSDGDVVVPELAPYFPHQFAIADADLAIYETLPTLDLKLTTTLRSGALITFPVQKTRFLRGRLRIGDGAPAFGQVTAHVGRHQDATSPLGGQGDFELQDVPTGWYFADVEYPGGWCTAVIEMPENDQLITDVGEIPCAPREAMR